MGALDDVQLHLVDDVATAERFMSWLGERRPSHTLAVDTETSGLDWTTDRVRLFQVGDAQSGWAIPWEDWRGVAKEFMRRWDGGLLFHNSKFDVMMLEMDGSLGKIEWSRVDDTMLMGYVLDQRLSIGLKPMAARYVDPMAAAAQSMLDDAMSDHGWTWATVPIDFPLYWSYGALDPVLTCRIHDAMRPRLDADHQARSAYEIELVATGVLRQMMQRGARVNVEFAAAKRDELWAQNEAIREWCQQYHGCLPSSTGKLADRFVELGAHLSKRTKGGALSTDKEVLEEVAIECGVDSAAGQLADLSLRSRRLTKVCNTYLGRFVTDAIDGRVYADINVVGAEKTGRMSMTGPGAKAMPLHQLPRKAEANPEALEVRNCFVPSEGGKLVMIDYEQIEWRLIGHFSQDPALLEVLRDRTVDPFTAMASQIFGVPVGKKDHRRQMTKNAAYAKGYGAGAAKFSLTAGVPLSVGGPFYEMFDQTYPTLKAFQQHVQRVGEERLRSDGEAWVRTPFGKKLVADPDKVYTLVNRLVQGTAADVLKIKLGELDNAGLAQYAILPVHDEVVFDVPEDLVEDVTREAVRVLDASEMFTVPMPVDAEGPYDRWGDKYA